MYLLFVNGSKMLSNLCYLEDNRCQVVNSVDGENIKIASEDREWLGVFTTVQLKVPRILPPVRPGHVLGRGTEQQPEISTPVYKFQPYLFSKWTVHWVKPELLPFQTFNIKNKITFLLSSPLQFIKPFYIFMWNVSFETISSSPFIAKNTGLIE